MDWNRAKPGIVLLICGIIAVGITYWGLAYNRGTLTVKSSAAPFVIRGMFDQPTTCDNIQCSYEVKPKIYDLRVEAAGFTTQSLTANVKRNREAEVAYEPLPVPQLELVGDPDDTYSSLIYSRETAAGDAIIWQRQQLSDQEITALENIEIERISSTAANPLVLLETDDGDVVELDLLNQRKRVIELPNDWLNWGLLAGDWLVWQEGGAFFYGPFSYQPEEKFDLPLQEIDQLVALDNQTGLFVSQVALAGAETESGTSITELFELATNGDEAAEVAEIGQDQPYLLYQLNLTTGEPTYLSTLEWTGENEVEWETRYAEADLEPVVYLVVDGDYYELRS